ncbi:MAG: mandelate racemase [Geminicoccaceae bacterium]
MSKAVRLLECRAGLRNVRTRMPFRFGVVTIEASPLLTLAADIELADGRRATGYAADFLAFRWFDKRPEKSLADNCADLLAAVQCAEALYRDAASEGYRAPFKLWHETHGEVERWALANDFNRLGASFGSSMLERAVIDGLGRALGKSLFQMVVDNDLGIDLDALSPELSGLGLRKILPDNPLQRVAARHTVGLADPITSADVEPRETVDDGLPETLEDYLAEDGIRYLKIKVSGDLDQDLERLGRIADLLYRDDRRFGISLDGNEQYREIERFSTLIVRLSEEPALKPLYRDILFIEQPLERGVALDPAIAPELKRLSAIKPVIIDEADGWVSAFKEAVALGYRGTSHKNCKGVYKSLHNLAWAKSHNLRLGCDELFMSAEDLSNLPVVALQADLATVAMLGIGHVERNGHHYFRGLGHLSEPEKQAALDQHPDLYERRGDEVFLRIDEGELACASIQTPGMGFSALPDIEAMISLDDWAFESLGQSG